MYKKEHYTITDFQTVDDDVIFWLSDQDGQTSFVDAHVTEESTISGIKILEGTINSGVKFNATMPESKNIGLFVLKIADKDDTLHYVDPFDVVARLKGLNIEDKTIK